MLEHWLFARNISVKTGFPAVDYKGRGIGLRDLHGGWQAAPEPHR